MCQLVELTTWDTGLAEVASLDEQQLSAAVDFEKLVQHNEAQVPRTQIICHTDFLTDHMTRNKLM